MRTYRILRPICWIIGHDWRYGDGTPVSYVNIRYNRVTPLTYCGRCGKDYN